MIFLALKEPASIFSVRRGNPHFGNALLLRLYDNLVLDEDRSVGLTLQCRERHVVQLVVAHQRPEIHAGRICLGARSC